MSIPLSIENANSGQVFWRDGTQLPQVSTFELDEMMRRQQVKDHRVVLKIDWSDRSTPVEAFILHCSCLSILKRVSKHDWKPLELFRLCQALQKERDRYFGIPKLRDLAGEFEAKFMTRFVLVLIVPGCPDPAMPLVPVFARKSFVQLREPPDAMTVSPIQRLPAEIILMILSYLPLSALVAFLSASRQCLKWSHNLMKEPSPFHRLYGGTIQSSDPEKLILALTSYIVRPKTRLQEGHSLDRRWQSVVRNPASELHGLDKRQEIFSAIEKVASLSPSLTSGSLYWDPPTACVLEPHQTSFDDPVHYRIITIDVPEDLDEMQIFLTELRGKSYICGIKLLVRGKGVLEGRMSDSSTQVAISELPKRLFYGQDALGLRCLKFENTPWCGGSPPDLQCWEGINFRALHTGAEFEPVSPRLRIVADVSESINVQPEPKTQD